MTGQALTDAMAEVAEAAQLAKWCAEAFKDKLTDAEVFQLNRVWEFTEAAKAILEAATGQLVTLADRDAAVGAALAEAVEANRKSREAVIHSGEVRFIDGIREGHNRAHAAILALRPEATAALERALTRAREVRELVWEDVDAICTRQKAGALGGHYSVVEFDANTDEAHFATNIDLGGLAFVFILEPDPLGGRRPKKHLTLEAAKAAAQADYAARIHAALQPMGDGQ